MSMIIRYPESLNGKFVARKMCKIVAIGDSIDDVINEVRRKGIDRREVVVDYIPDKEITLITRCRPFDEFDCINMYVNNSIDISGLAKCLQKVGATGSLIIWLVRYAIRLKRFVEMLREHNEEEKKLLLSLFPQKW